LFQSAPRSEDRGDFAAVIRFHNVPVSIRAPIRRPGRLIRASMANGWVLFQSAPRSEDRGDSGNVYGITSCDSFNPRPDPKTGATNDCDGLHSKICVSIRAPIRRPGRRWRQCCPRLRLVFQSAPRSEDRGDCAECSPNPKSKCFNPRPDPKTGATESGCGSGLGEPVSIRAPIRRPGRRPGAGSCGIASRFQSAPRSEDRGDLCYVGRRGHGMGFNPRPDPKTGATQAVAR